MCLLYAVYYLYINRIDTRNGWYSLWIQRIIGIKIKHFLTFDLKILMSNFLILKITKSQIQYLN